MNKKILKFMRFLRASPCFSNSAEIILTKILFRSQIITYKFRGYSLVSFESFADGVSIRECLVGKAYEKSLRGARPAGRTGTYINIGANVGAFDIAINELWGRQTQGVAVEMNPWTCARLQSNIYLNQISTAVINAAVLDRHGSVDVNIQASGPGQSLSAQVDVNHKTSIKTITLSEIPNPGPDTEIDLLKVDCEGAEYQIFASTTSEEFKKYKNIVMEIHPREGFKVGELIKTVAARGNYKYEVLGHKDGTELVYFFR